MGSNNLTQNFIISSQGFSFGGSSIKKPILLLREFKREMILLEIVDEETEIKVEVRCSLNFGSRFSHKIMDHLMI